MPDRDYKIEYSAPPAKVVRDHAAIDAAIAKTMGNATKLAAVLKSIGQNSSGLKAIVAELRKLDSALKASGSGAASAEKSLKGVGTGNRAVAELTKRLAEMKDQLDEVTGAAAGVGSGSGLGGGKGAGGGAGGVAGAGAGRSAVAGVARHAAYALFRRGLDAAGRAGKDNKQFFQDAAEMASDYRKDLQELAVLQGKPAADDDLIKGDLAFQKNTLLNPEDSKTFRLEFGGAVSPALKARGKDGQPNITPAVAKELEVEAGKFTARYGLDATTGGRMAGLLGVTTKVPTAAAGIGVMEQTMGQLNVEGVGPVRGMAGQMLGLSGTMLEEGGGRFKNFPEMAARFAASTVNQAGNASRAKTRIVQSDRLLRKLAADRESDLGIKAGITDGDDYETAIRKLAPHIAGDGGDRALVDSGYGNSTERIAVIEEAKMNSIVDKQLAAMPSADRAAKLAQSGNAAYPDTTTGRQQAAENAEFSATVGVGMQGERLKAATASARARMIQSGQLKAKGSGIIGDLYRDVQGFFSGVSGEDQRVNNEAIRSLIEEGKKVNVDVAKSFPRLEENLHGRVQDADQFASDFGMAAGQVDAAKALRQIGRAADNAANALDQMKGNGGGNGNAGGGMAPPPLPPVGNGGAGTNPGRR